MPVLKSFKSNSSITGTIHFNPLLPWHPCFFYFLTSAQTILASAPFIKRAERLTGELQKKDAGKSLWPQRHGAVSYVKWEKGWPSQANRLWAVSHSWQTHNYSISSTINGNTLKLLGEIKQTPSPYSSNPSASTLPPITPLYPFIPSP